MLRTFMSSLTIIQRKEIVARILAFCYCGFCSESYRYHYKSFIGRDFKAWMQMALFVIPPYVFDNEQACWFALAKVYHIHYNYIMLYFSCMFILNLFSYFE